MPHYYFHLHNSVGVVRDEQGRELKDVEAARSAAIKDVRSIISDEVKRGRLDLRGWMEVADGDGTVVLSLPFREALDLRLERDVP